MQINDELFPFKPPMELDDPDFLGTLPDRHVNDVYLPTGAVYPDKINYITEELLFRDRFVEEYIKDYNPIDALMRLGQLASTAKSFAPRIMAERYVKELIGKVELQMTSKTPEERDASLRQEVLMSLRHVMNDKQARGGDIVSAAKAIAAMQGFNAPVKTSVTNNGGVMLVPSSLSNADEWAALAVVSQAELKVKVLEGVVQ